MATALALTAGCNLDGESHVTIEYDDVTLAILSISFGGASTREVEVSFIHPVTLQPVTVICAKNTQRADSLAALALTMQTRGDGKKRLPMALTVIWKAPV